MGGLHGLSNVAARKMTALVKAISQAKTGFLRLRLAVVFEACLIVVGMAQWMFSKLQSEPLSPETWGEAAMQLPLEAWAVAMMGGSLLTFLGLLYPPNLTLIRIGCIVQIGHISFLGSSALFTGGDTVIVVFAFCLLVPVHLFLAARAGHDY
jgi:hypothetical protein